MKLSPYLITTICLYLPATVKASTTSTAEQLYVSLRYGRTLILICSRDRNDPVYRAALEEECGPLGVLDVPDGALESEVRHCRDHPLSLKYPQLLRDHVHPSEWPMEAEKETKGRKHLAHDPDFLPDPSGSLQFGCEKGTCWRVCDSPRGWCWVALNAQDGPWVECSVDGQCGRDIGTVCSGEDCQ